jgi:hypothetical protein
MEEKMVEQIILLLAEGGKLGAWLYVAHLGTGLLKFFAGMGVLCYLGTRVIQALKEL